MAGRVKDMDRWLGDGGMEVIGLVGASFVDYGVDGEDLGWVTGTWVPTALACNPHGTAQAGIHSLLLDAAMNFAINAALPGRGRTRGTLEMKTETMRGGIVSHIRWMRRDAVLTSAQDGMNAVEARERRAARARIALVAGFRDVIEVVTARSLQQVPRSRRFVPQLSARAGYNRARQYAVLPPHAAVRGQIRVRDQCPDPQTAVACILDAIEVESGKVDDVRRRFDLQFHEIEQVGAAGDKLGVGRARGGRGGCGGRRRALESERLHAPSPATSRIASRIFE